MPNLTASAATFESEDAGGSVENPVAKDSALSPKPNFSEDDDLDIGCMSPRPGDDGGECVDRGGSGQEVPAWIVDAKKKMVWDVLMLFLILYSVLIIPWALGFDVPLYDYDTSFHATLLCISITVDLAFVLDMALTFFSPAVEPATGLPVYDKAVIASNYLQGWFFIDLVSTIPIDVVFDIILKQTASAAGLKLLRATRLVKLLKLMRIMRLSRTLGSLVSFGSPWYSTVQACKILAYYMMLGHWISCFWYLTLRINHEHRLESDEFYLINNEVLQCGNRVNLMYNMTLSERYSCSMYWTLQTLTTVGYGDILPNSNAERLYNIFAFGCGTAVFAIVSACVVKFAMNKDTGVAEYRDKVVATMNYMRRRRIDAHLIHGVQVYYQHRWESKQSLDESVYFADLPASLRYSIFSSLNARLLSGAAIFEEALKIESFAETVVDMLVSQIYMAGDYIFAEGDVSTAMYFVARGRVQLSNGKHTTTINEGTYFGDGGCILQVARKSLAQSLTYVEIFALSNTLLVELCEDYSPLKESVEEKRQSLLAAAKEQGEEESTPNHLALQRGEGALTRSLGLMSPSVNASRSRTSAPAGQASSDATSSDAVPAADEKDTGKRRSALAGLVNRAQGVSSIIQSDASKQTVAALAGDLRKARSDIAQLQNTAARTERKVSRMLELLQKMAEGPSVPEMPKPFKMGDQDSPRTRTSASAVCDDNDDFDA